MIQKLASRKFWLAVAAFLASFAAGVAGIADPTVCAVCMALSAGIYAACEAYVDGQSAKSTQKVIQATSSDKATVAAILAPEEPKEVSNG